MYGVIFLWRVRPEKRAEHDAIVRATLQAERDRCPEVLLNLTMGPAAGGTCAEVQVYADEQSSVDFPRRVEREDAELRRLWSLYGGVCDPDGWQTIRFEGMDFLRESFVRAGAGVACVGGSIEERR